MNQITKPAAWHARARQKYYLLSGESDGLRAALAASYGRLEQHRSALLAVQRSRAALADALAWNDPLPGRDAERNRSVDRLAELDAEIERLGAVYSEARRHHENIMGRQTRLAPLVDACARLLVELRLLSREEVSL